MLELLQNAVDEAMATLRREIEATTPHRISCPTSGKGCWGCCRGAVVVQPEEVAQVAPLVDGPGWNRVNDLMQILFTSKDDTEFDQLLTTAICPLLDPETKVCTVYEKRPLVCRSYVVVSPVDDCYPERSGIKDVATPTDAYMILANAQLGLANGGPMVLQPFTLALYQWKQDQV